jgi:hypothetical protein
MACEKMVGKVYLDEPPMISRLVQRMHHDFRYELSTGQRSALVAYASFSATIVAVRGLTTAIRGQHLPAHDIIIRGVHIHHFLPGIALLTTAGAFGVRGSDRPSVHCLLGATYGAGCALVTDELPLLLNLRDVYWAREGRWAVDLALTIIGGVGAYFSAIPLWRGLRAELAGLLRQGIPQSANEEGDIRNQRPSTNASRVSFGAKGCQLFGEP